MMNGKFESVSPDHPIGRVANAISDQAFTLAATAGMSRWDLCVALANAIGQTLADAGGSPNPPPGVTMPRRGKPLTPEIARHRMDDLRTVMQAAYELRSTKGSG